MGEVSRRTLMGYWDCPYCNRKKIEGTTYDCPGCGHQRGEDVQIYLDLANKQYIDNHIKKGADWYCDCCNSYNPIDKAYCENCGSAREDSDKNYFTFNKERRNPIKDVSKLDAETYEETKIRLENAKEDLRKAKQKQEDSYSVTKKEPSEPNESNESNEDTEHNIKGFVPTEDSSIFDETSKDTTKLTVSACLKVFLSFVVAFFDLLGDGLGHIGQSLKNLPWKVIFRIALGVIAAWLFVLVVRPVNIQGTVEEVRWTNTVYVEELKTFNESDWSLPSGARLQYTKEEIRSYEKVLDHMEEVTKSRVVEDGGHTEKITKTRTVVDGYKESKTYVENGDGTWDEIVDSEPIYKTETYTEEHWVPDYKTEYYTEEVPVYKNVPVYDTKYYYEIDRWAFDHTVVATDTNRELYWPNVTLGEKERESRRITTYSVMLNYTYKDKETRKLFDVSENVWKDLKVGDRIEAKVSGLGLTLKEYTKLD